MNSGKLVYFLAFHRPFSTQLMLSATHSASRLPVVRLTTSISSATLGVGQVQVITVGVKPEETVQGLLEVWIMAPNHRQVYRSPLNENTPSAFSSNTSQAQTYQFPVLASAPKGTYLVSAKLTSVNQQTDYAINHDFAPFKVL